MGHRPLSAIQRQKQRGKTLYTSFFLRFFPLVQHRVYNIMSAAPLSTIGVYEISVYGDLTPFRYKSARSRDSI